MVFNLLLFANLQNDLPKKLMRTRKRSNVSGIDYDYVKKIGTMKGKKCVLPGKTKTGKERVATYIGNLCESITFGYTKQRFIKNAKIEPRQANAKYPKVFKHLKKIAEIYFPEFSYDCITLNHNLKCAPHKDSNNRGYSYIVGFGNYTGGNLNVDGKSVDIKYKPLTFNGKKQLHYTEDFEGDRWSAVFFKSPLFNKLEDDKKVKGKVVLKIDLME